MAYFNLKNPLDANKKDWIEIKGEVSIGKRKETIHTEDVGGFFEAVMSGTKIIDASELQVALNAAGLTVSSDPEMIPNGVTISSAGILIAFQNDLKQQDYKTIKDIIQNLHSKPRRVEGPPGSSNRERKLSSVPLIT